MPEILKKIIKWFESIKIRKEVYTKGDISPKRDWYIILVTSFFLICLLAGFSYYFYTQVDGGRLFVSDKETTFKPLVIDDELLTKTVDEINNREKNLIEFNQNKVIPANPSI